MQLIYVIGVKSKAYYVDPDSKKKSFTTAYNKNPDLKNILVCALMIN